MTANPAEIDRLVRSCMPMVHQIAKGFRSSYIEYDDLIGAGNVGLVKAAQKFDPARKVKFTTYSSYWIRAHMFALIECGGSRRMSHSERKVFYNRKKVRASLGPDATEEHIAAFLGVSVSVFDSLRARHTVSLDVPLPGEYVGMTYGDNKPSNTENAAELYERLQITRNMKKSINKALTRLTPRQQVIIRERFFGDEKKTLKDVGISLGGISRERVRQIEEIALKRLRAMLANKER